MKVRAWISIHREDLFANWTLLIEQGTFTKYEPPRLFDNRIENTLDNLAMNTQILLTDHTKNLQSPDVAMVVMLVNAGSDSPRLSVFPEDRIGLINADRFSPILLDKLLLREIWRTIGFTGGSGYAPYRGCVMQPAFNDNEIAGLMGDVLQPMTLQPFRKFEDRFKMKRTRMVPYELACEQGWAPAPTNAIQKAIWDKVHAAPKNPMKIEFDPKKGR